MTGRAHSLHNIFGMSIAEDHRAQSFRQANLVSFLIVGKELMLMTCRANSLHRIFGMSLAECHRAQSFQHANSSTYPFHFHLFFYATWGSKDCLGWCCSLLASRSTSHLHFYLLWHVRIERMRMRMGHIFIAETTVKLVVALTH